MVTFLRLIRSSVSSLRLPLVGLTLLLLAGPADAQAPVVLQYDDGNVSGTADVLSQMVGNRFAPATAGAWGSPASLTITQVTFNMVNTFFSSAVISFYDNINGTTAQRVSSAGQGVRTGWNTKGINNQVQGPSFLAGVFQFMPASTAVGVGTGTTGGQGHHGVSMNDGTTGTALTPLPGSNALFRVSVQGIVPPELSSCGDGTTDSDEDCDDSGESATCNADCTSSVCGDTKVNATAGETCDDGNVSNGDCCSSTCVLDPENTACGTFGGDDCTDADTCNDSGTCLTNQYVSEGTSCGDTSASDCDSADTCDGVGACEDNLTADGDACTDDGETCTTDLCAGGVCAHDAGNFGTECRASADGQCDTAETCDGSATSCPADVTVPDETACDDSDPATLEDQCEAGICLGSSVLPMDLQRIVVWPASGDAASRSFGIVKAKGEIDAAIDFDASGGLTATVRIGGPVPQEVSVAFGASECQARSGGRVICKDSATPTRLKHRVILRTTSSGDQKVKAYFAGLDINHGISAPVELELTADGTTVSGSSSNCRGGKPPRNRIVCK